jgi:hypothetical protein
MKISFDFDSTLECEEMQELAIKFIASGADVFITTSRTDYHEGLKIPNNDLFEVADRIGIKKENITFTKFKHKYKFTKDFDIHYDDDEIEIDNINKFPSKCMGFLYEPKHNNQQANF